MRKFLGLDRQQKKLFIQAFFLLGWARISLLRKPFKVLVAKLDLHRESILQPPLVPSAQETARSIGWAVRTAASFTPWKSTCLVQVLAAQSMLRKQGIAGVFYLGATNNGEEQDSSGFLAHAWLMCNGEFITGEAGHKQYTVVSFSWP
ncbi:lasso peptide biosynthesis B2 protein [Pseudomonadota bacterium]